MDRAYSLNPPPMMFSAGQFGLYGRSLVLAGLITLLLLAVMTRLIATDYEEPTANPYPKVQSVVMPTVEPTVRKSEPPVRPDTPPPQPVTTRIDPSVEPVEVPTVVAPPYSDGPGFDPSIVSRAPVPIFKTAPQYPRVALRRGLEGYVVVEFTITANGSVRDARAIAGYDSAGQPTEIFNRSAVAAVERFKYQPQLEDGVAVERTGVRNRIRYRMAD
ncbi:energy transducer TonB [Microbulbifer litoralis]|uniref:energy transducer TonB n=1 Tax=Microbulbifer litoralis TaxID=2933965 RepID=UPI002028AC27|nr:energy transducer TonB [Microbulbifer sp. GX H0434]